MCSACTGDYENPDVMVDEPIEEIEDRLQLALKNAYEAYLRGLYREVGNVA